MKVEKKTKKFKLQNARKATKRDHNKKMRMTTQTCKTERKAQELLLKNTVTLNRKIRNTAS